MRCDTLWRNARLATMAESHAGLGEVMQGVVASLDGRILYAGDAADALALEADRVIDCEGRWITPGLIDCHTHLVWAGSRSREFELRLAGATYEELARAGGGILATMRATRAASLDDLVSQALPRLDALLAEGATTVEIKSGYGLNLEAELKQLRAARALADRRPVTIRTTFLGAHAVPPEFARDADGYVDLVCRSMIPAVAAAGLADAVDAFCEEVAFSPPQVRRVFRAAEAAGLPVKIHADGVRAMAGAGTVATLLPGAYYFLRDTQPPPVRLLRDHGVPIALATDCNPGSSPLTSLLLTMNMAATLFRLTVEECLLGVTRHGARALGLQDRVGTLEAGKDCDLAVWDVERLGDLVYRIGFNPLHGRAWRGQWIA